MISRRQFLGCSGLVGLMPAAASRAGGKLGAGEPPADHRLEIAPLTLELAPRRTLTTTGYNGQVPGPLLRLPEGRPVTIEVVNHTERAEVVHWHGLFLPAEVDGAVEEGTAPIPPNARARYTFTPRPAGFRWYHTHTMAMSDFTRAQYGGQHGFLMIAPRDDPARYDAEFFLALHDWDGHMRASDDGAMNPAYAAATINGRLMGFGEPLRVKQGQRVLLHVLNSSPTEVHWLSLSGHLLRILALDGNPVPRPCAVPMLRLAPAERICALVEMNNPGVWVLGEVRKHVQALGMAVIVEYQGCAGPARWDQPSALVWEYARFAAPGGLAGRGGSADLGGGAERATLVPLSIESKFRGHGAMEAWTINGRSYPDSGIAPLIHGRRYRLQFIIASVDDHPLHLHRHSFELRRLGEPLASVRDPMREELRGVVKDVVLVDAGTRAEVEFVADNPGATLLHCHQQNHMDLGFMMLMRYA